MAEETPQTNTSQKTISEDLKSPFALVPVLVTTVCSSSLSARLIALSEAQH